VNRVADLNPQEIESVEILKSAAATAMYGSRATTASSSSRRSAVGEWRGGFSLNTRWAAAWRIGCSARDSSAPS